MQLVKTASGKYNVYVAKGKTSVTININIKGNKMGSEIYRVRNLPTPKCIVGGIPGNVSKVSKTQLINSIKDGLIIGLGPEFVYQGLRYKTLGCKVKLFSKINGSKEVSCSSNLNNAIPYCKQLRSGDFVQFSRIRALGPDGQIKNIDNKSYTLK